MKKRLVLMMFILPILVCACGHAQWTDEDDGEVRLERKSSQRGWLGLSTQDMTRRLARSIDSKTEKGALVNSVIEDSPAEEADIKEEDIIVEFNGKEIEGADDLVVAVRTEKPGASVSLVVVRKNERKTLKATLEKAPRLRSFSFSVPPVPKPPRYVYRGEGLGLSLMQLANQLGAYFEVPDGKGLLVVSVEPKSNAEKSGFKAGDVIISISNKPVERIDDIGRTLRKYNKGDKVECEIIRKGSRMNLAFEVPEMRDLHGYYFDFGTEDSGLDRLDLRLHDIPWEDLDHIDLDRHRFHHNMDILRKNLQRMGRTLRDDIIKMRDKVQEKLKESVGA